MVCPGFPIIPTTELIKNIKVDYEEVSVKVKQDNNFNVKQVNRISSDIEDKADIEVVSDYIEEEQQITLTFDLPLTNNTKEEEKENELTSAQANDDINKISVNDYVELVTVNETNEEGDIRYALDDYITVESSMNKKQTESKEFIDEIEHDIVFEKKVIKQNEVEESPIEEVDPINSPISEILKERAEERRRKMKDFNYKFNSAKIDDIEKVPAYKRQGVNLNEVKHSSETDISRTSVGLDDNDDIQLRNNNSFLHDNVD